MTKIFGIECIRCTAGSCGYHLTRIHCVVSSDRIIMSSFENSIKERDCANAVQLCDNLSKTIFPLFSFINLFNTAQCITKRSKITLLKIIIAQLKSNFFTIYTQIFMFVVLLKMVGKVKFNVK